MENTDFDRSRRIKREQSDYVVTAIGHGFGEVKDRMYAGCRGRSLLNSVDHCSVCHFRISKESPSHAYDCDVKITQLLTAALNGADVMRLKGVTRAVLDRAVKRGDLQRIDIPAGQWCAAACVRYSRASVDKWTP